MDRHFCFINIDTNLVEVVGTFTEENLPSPKEGYLMVEVAEHDPQLFGKKYENGAFVDPKTGGV